MSQAALRDFFGKQTVQVWKLGGEGKENHIFLET